MLKGYINRWEERKKPEQHKVDYWFSSRIEGAATWPTKEEAESNCVIFNYHRIVIPSSHGGTHVCDGFKVEQRVPGEFVAYCMAPFILKETTNGESTNQ